MNAMDLGVCKGEIRRLCYVCWIRHYKLGACRLDINARYTTMQRLEA